MDFEAKLDRKKAKKPIRDFIWYEITFTFKLVFCLLYPDYKYLLLNI